jgi:ABC-2 type transport system ATP-binding protein
MSGMVDGITEFADLGERINHPVRTYSSGMRARLAFAISTAIEPEILLLDEGIGMADAAFTLRARDRLEDFMRRAGMLIVASHSDHLLTEFCTKGVVMDRGRVAFSGPVDEALHHYRMTIGT